MSMKGFDRLGIIAVFAVCAALTPAVAGEVTVGRFYNEIAKAKHLTSGNAAAAEASLRGAGIDLPRLALGKSLTEGDLTSISNALGVAVTTQKPSQPVSEVQLNTYMATFGSRLGTPRAPGANPYQTDGQGTGGTDPGNSANGKGKKKGHNKSSSEPE
jgi:hypothetical protein